MATWLIWSPPWETENTDVDAPTTATPESAVGEREGHGDPASPGAVRIGTTADVVRVIEGDPVMINGNRWEYGPSWIYFQGGAVVDWYSSPLHPLETATAHPQPNDK